MALYRGRLHYLSLDSLTPSTFFFAPPHVENVEAVCLQGGSEGSQGMWVAAKVGGRAGERGARVRE